MARYSAYCSNLLINNSQYLNEGMKVLAVAHQLECPKCQCPPRAQQRRAEFAVVSTGACTVYQQQERIDGVGVGSFP